MSKQILNTTFKDMKNIYITLLNLDDGEEIVTRDLTKVLKYGGSNPNNRLLSCITTLCEFGMTIAEDSRGNKTYYSLLPSDVNEIIYNRHLKSA